MELRDYQIRAVSEVRSEIASGKKKVIMVLPTGAGKSIIFSEIIRLAVEKGNSVLWLVHRRNLVTQMQETLSQFNIQTGIIMAGIESNTYESVQLGTIQTYSRRLNLDDIENNRFFINADLILLDECHRTISKSYRDIIKLYQDKVIIGCTATPMRSDGRGMGEVYDSIVDVVSVNDLTDKGFLSDARYFAPATPDLEKIKVVRGDYETKELDKRMNQAKLIGDVVENWLRIAEGRPTIVFCVTVKHSKAVAKAFQDAGINSYHLDARSPDEEREYAFKRMEDGDLSVICNVALYQEGMDCPNISCVVMARPTKSFGLYKQCCGRGLRPAKGKVDCIIVDHSGVIEEHGFLDDPVCWTLDGKEKAYKKNEKKEKEKKPVKCKVCNLVFEGSNVCPDCGSPVNSFGKKVDTIDAELKEINGKKATMMDKMRWYGMAICYVRKKGWQPGAASHIYRDKIGVWPKGMKHMSPIEPDIYFLNWIKHRNIKRAKAREKTSQLHGQHV